MKKITFLLCISFVALSTPKLFAQNYKTAIGIRGGGYENGLTIKHFYKSNTAVEGILGFRPGVFVLTGLIEKHQTAFNEQQLQFYYGAGAHIGGVENGRRYKRFSGDDRIYDRSRLLLGADAILGLEWSIPEIPFVLGVDLHPRLELATGPYLDIEPAVSLRFTF